MTDCPPIFCEYCGEELWYDLPWGHWVPTSDDDSPVYHQPTPESVVDRLAWIVAHLQELEEELR